MIREAAVAGMFYPNSPSELREMISEMVDKNAVKEDVIGLIMPHAGYVYSGSVAGATISKVNLKDTCIIIGFNHRGIGKPYSIMTNGIWKTPLGEVAVNSHIGKQILNNSKYLQEDYSAFDSPEHSIEVQLPFLQYFKPDIKIAPINIAPYKKATIYKEIGREIAKVIEDSQDEVMIIVSSDMHHKERNEQLESSQGKDNLAIEPILALNEDELLNRIQKYYITMCGYAGAVSLIAAVKELGAKKVELVMQKNSADVTGDYARVVGYAGIIIKKAEDKDLSEPVELAKKTIETYVNEGRIIETPNPLPPLFQEKAGVFVSLHKFDQLRGCIGTFEPAHDNIAEEIISNAISSATRDPRFSPVTADELKQLEYNVDVLTTPEPVNDISELDAKKYGVIVEKDYRKGLLLPDLEGVDTAEQQIDICRRKAGIMPHEKVQLYRFEVKRYK
ncbi:MAG: AmmeMemoRadiSam system protein B [Dehalococcoidales bacterium]|nr:AmmeMemoRadiSam system protein B [Dehalococcoidales bacterium]